MIAIALAALALFAPAQAQPTEQQPPPVPAPATAPATPTTVAPAPPPAPAPAPATANAPGPRAPEEVIEEIVAWINDDVVLWNDLRMEEQQQVQQLLQDRRRDTRAEQLAQQVQTVRDKVLADMISQRLIVQEAERLYDLDEIKKDVLKRWKEKQKVRTDEELDRQLAQWGMTRAELEDRLVQSSAPDIVIDMQVNRNLSVSEQEAREFYEQNKDRMSTPAQVTFREIVLLANDPVRRAQRADEARQLAARARNGDFVELVRASSEAPSKGLDGRIGPVQPGDLLPAIGRALLDLQTGQVSEPIETEQGWHIVKVEERREGKTPAFEDVRAEAEDGVRAAKFGPALESYLMSLWDGATIEVRRSYADRLPVKWRERVKTRD